MKKVMQHVAAQPGTGACQAVCQCPALTPGGRKKLQATHLLSILLCSSVEALMDASKKRTNLAIASSTTTPVRMEYTTCHLQGIHRAQGHAQA